MDSPPSCSLSATGALSDLGSSGLGGSISSDSVRAHLAIEMQESDIESKSLSQDSFDYSDGMCGQNFNTLKKGPGWAEIEVTDVAIKPPPEFQDSPSPPDSVSLSAPIQSYPRYLFSNKHHHHLYKTTSPPSWLYEVADGLVHQLIEEALVISSRISWPEGRIIHTPPPSPSSSSSSSYHPNTQQSSCNHTTQLSSSVPQQHHHHPNSSNNSHQQTTKQLFWASEMLPSSSSLQASCTTVTITPYNTLNRPNSRSSLASSRLSSSHNSINTSGLCNKADDSSFITSAMSHDVLTTSEISDMYNVPFDSDIYTVPIDVVRPFHDTSKSRLLLLQPPQQQQQQQQQQNQQQRPRRHRHHRKRRRNVSTSSQSELEAHIQQARHYCNNKPRAITHVIKSQKLLTEVSFSSGGDNNGVNNGGVNGKRHSVPGTSGRNVTGSSRHQSNNCVNNHVHNNVGEPIHMTLHEVRQYLETLYSSSSDSSENKIKRDKLSGTTTMTTMTTTTIQTPIHLSMQKCLTNNIVGGNNNNNKYSNGVGNDKTLIDTTTLLTNKTNNGLININNNNNNNHNNNSCLRKHKKNSLINIKYKKNTKDGGGGGDGGNKLVTTSTTTTTTTDPDKTDKNDKVNKKSQRNFSLNIKQTLCNIFRFRKIGSPEHFVNKRNSIDVGEDDDNNIGDSDHHVNNNNSDVSAQKLSFFKRALPPLPRCNGHVNSVEEGEDALSAIVGSKIDSMSINSSVNHGILLSSRDDDDLPPEDTSMDFAASIEKVKDYGWYWGPMSGEAAEKILSNEPDGSFIVRDSSDDHYIFSLSFRLNNCVRHVRIEHDQGNFSFGSCTKFKSHTIVDFIENAVEHSRSGRYLFFLHRRPVLGPMRVQLLHPVSRFKQVQSLQHTCRFVILKMVRRDLISTLPLPRRLIDYLSTPHYYSEQLDEQDERAESPVSSSTGELEKICFTPQSLS